MRIWLDDVRVPPDGFETEPTNPWVWCRTAADAIAILTYCHVSEISFDHDLGPSIDTGYDVAKVIEKAAHVGMIRHPIVWHVHSANPVGRTNIIAAMESAEKAWNK